jgi:LysM domain
VDAGGGSDNQDRGSGRTPPDEQQIRLGRARIARSGEPLDDQSGLSGGLIGGSSSQDLEQASGFSTPGAIGTSPIGGPSASGGEGLDVAPRFRPWSEPAAGNTGPMRCHFLRSVGPDGRLVEAQRAAVPTHRCAAFGDPLPLSLRQQELVCLQRVHVSCPRYVRGTVLANENPAVQPDAEPRKPMPLLSIVGIGLVGLAVLVVLSASLGLPPFGGAASKPTDVIVVTTRAPSSSGLSVAPSVTPKTSPTATATAAVVSSPSASAKPTPTAAPTPTPTPTATRAPTPTATRAPTPTATRAPTPTPAAATWPPGATASRMNLVVPCLGQSNCYVYTVRGSGPPPGGNGSPVADTLSNIATFFGVDLNQVKALNSWAAAGIKAGDKLKIPPPTR